MYEEVDKRFDERFKHITNIGVQCDPTTLVNIKQFIHEELDRQRKELQPEFCYICKKPADAIGSEYCSFPHPISRKVVNITEKDNMLDHFFYATLNANDTFAYCCSDEHEIGLFGLCVLKHIYKLYGSDGITALMAHERDLEPIEELITEEYVEARKEIKRYIKEKGISKYYAEELDRQREELLDEEKLLEIIEQHECHHGGLPRAVYADQWEHLAKAIIKELRGES